MERSREEKEGREPGAETRSPADMKEIMVSHAHSILRQATMVRGDNSKPGTAGKTIPQTVKTLHREKTALRTTATHIVTGKMTSKDDSDEDDEMTQYLARMRSQKIQEMTDSDFDTDLEEDFEKGGKEAEETRSALYEKTCRKLSVRPLPAIRDALASGSDVIVPNRCMNALDMLSLTNALVQNKTVKKLILDGNRIGDPGAQCLAWLLQDHGCFLQAASLCDNKIGDDGLQALGEMIEENKSLKFLNLSGNLAQNLNLSSISEALKDNRQLQYLNLSHNEIGDHGATLLASALASNEGVQTLDLSWNKIRPPGAVALCTALKDNITLRSLHLAMNGLGRPGAVCVGHLLTENSSLTYLNLTYNRIHDEGVAHIAKGLQKNEALHHLIIHNNPITTLSAMTLLKAISTNPNTQMWKVDMSTIPVVQEAVDLSDELNHKTGDFVFRYSGIVNCEVAMCGSENTLNPRNPLALVKEYIENEGLRLIDFFKIMDRDKSGSISRDEFVIGLNNANVLLTQAQMDKLMEILDADGDGEIDLSELIEGDKEFRRRARERRKTEMDLIATLAGARTDYFGYQSTS